ncbi:MAG: hypothetical protein JWM16_711 [Verrucomicrobiales bacterium]|nr:hypothetical protein [Verrucomicrobiales bacterium]
METKDIIGLALIPIGILGGIGVLCCSQKLRDIAFFMLSACTVITDRLDINFFSRQWYRGTTRGIEFSFIDILAISLLASTILIPRNGSRRIFWPASLGFMLAYLAWQCCSIAISDPKLFGIFEMSKTIRAIIVFVAAAFYIRGERELRILVFGICCAVFLEGMLSLKHRLILHVDRATGTLDHANSLSMFLCMTTPLVVASINSKFPTWQRWFGYCCLGLATIASILTISRAGIPIFAVVVLGSTLFCMTWKITPQKVGVTLVACMGLAAVLAVQWNTLAERFKEAGLDQELDGGKFENRGQYFRLARVILEDKPMGVGLNNWSYHVSKTYGTKIGSPYEDYDDIPQWVLKTSEIFDWSAKYAPPAHNLGVITIGEMGIPGAVLFGLLWLRWFSMGAKFLKRMPSFPASVIGTGLFFCICGIFLQSLTEWVYRQTAILLTFHLLLGALASLYYARRQMAVPAAEKTVRKEKTKAAHHVLSPAAS